MKNDLGLFAAAIAEATGECALERVAGRDGHGTAIDDLDRTSGRLDDREGGGTGEGLTDRVRGLLHGFTGMAIIGGDGDAGEPSGRHKGFEHGVFAEVFICPDHRAVEADQPEAAAGGVLAPSVFAIIDELPEYAAVAYPARAFVVQAGFHGLDYLGAKALFLRGGEEDVYLFRSEAGVYGGIERRGGGACGEHTCVILFYRERNWNKPSSRIRSGYGNGAIGLRPCRGRARDRPQLLQKTCSKKGTYRDCRVAQCGDVVNSYFQRLARDMVCDFGHAG